MISDGVRRSVDVVAAVCGLVLLSPVLAGAAIATRLSMGGPVVYRQRRLGLGGQPFELLKFRSMRQDAEKDSGPVWASQQDDRVTRVGRFIRKTRSTASSSRAIGIVPSFTCATSEACSPFQSSGTM